MKEQYILSPGVEDNIWLDGWKRVVTIGDSEELN